MLAVRSNYDCSSLHVWPAVQRIHQNGQDHRHRPQKVGRECGPDQRFAHLGLGDNPPSAHPYDRARQRLVAGRHPMDLLQARVLLARTGAVETVPALVP